MATPILTVERLRELLSYDPDTGIFTWLKARGRTAIPGAVAGGNDGHGYIRIRVDGVRYKAHRLAWLYFYGSWPTNCIDHINFIRSDNRIVNLRDVSSQENTQHAISARSNSSTGILGVKKSPRCARWAAKICVDGRDIHLGSFKTKEDAGEAYIAAKKKLHPGYVSPGDHL